MGGGSKVTKGGGPFSIFMFNILIRRVGPFWAFILQSKWRKLLLRDQQNINDSKIMYEIGELSNNEKAKLS